MEAWLDPVRAEADGDALLLFCPSAFHRERVRQRLLERIERCVAQEAGCAVPVRLEVGSGSPNEAESPVAAQPEMLASASVRAVPARAPAQAALPYSFDSFVVGACNALAREACFALAAGPGGTLSSVYLTGAPGLGKTHLARSVVAEAAGAARAVYVSAETFTSEFQAHVRSGRMEGFKRRYRGADLLVVEDVQFLPGKKATQLELFHTIDYLRDSGARLVFTGDRPPSEIPGLDPRLRSRWNGSLVAQLEPPDAQVRRTILRTRAAAGGVRIPSECLDLLVERLRGSVRDLEGALIQLVATSALLKRRIDRQLTEQALQKVAPQTGPSRGIEPRDVVEVVASFFQTTPAALASRSRRRDVLVPRQLSMYLAHRYTDASLTEIGRGFDRDHPAVKNAIERVERGILERAPLRYQVEALCARLDERLGSAS